MENLRKKILPYNEIMTKFCIAYILVRPFDRAHAGWRHFFDSTICRGKDQPILISSELCYARLSLEFCVIAFRVSAVEWEGEIIGVYTYRSAGKLL